MNFTLNEEFLVKLVVPRRRHGDRREVKKVKDRIPSKLAHHGTAFLFAPLHVPTLCIFTISLVSGVVDEIGLAKFVGTVES